MQYPVVFNKQPFDVFPNGLNAVYHVNQWWFDLETIMKFVGYADNYVRSPLIILKRLKEGCCIRIKFGRKYSYFINFTGWLRLIAYGHVTADDRVLSSYLSTKAFMLNVTDAESSIQGDREVESV